ncbi:MAG TPA: hypothetical protein VGC10_05965 [Sphingomonas sp.]
MIASLLLAILAQAAVADPAGQDIVVKAITGCGPPFARVYIAPMGEPFRTDGKSDPEAAWFARADADHDGRLTLAEFVADADRVFATLDINHDGEIDPQEVIVYERDVAPEIRLFQLDREIDHDQHRPRDRAGRKAAKKAARDRYDYVAAYGAGRFASLNIPEPVVSADLDINRGVSKAEFAQVAAQRFQTLDDGNRAFLTAAGLPRSPAQQEIDACHATARKKT